MPKFIVTTYGSNYMIAWAIEADNVHKAVHDAVNEVNWDNSNHEISPLNKKRARILIAQDEAAGLVDYSTFADDDDYVDDWGLYTDIYVKEEAITG